MRLLRYAPSDSSTYVKYASGVLGRKPCIHIRLHHLATNPREKCGLEGEIFTGFPDSVKDYQVVQGAKEVIGAGRWVVDQGKILAITNESPPYQPDLEQMKQTVMHLYKSGLDLIGDGNGLLVLIFSEIDETGPGTHPRQYRVKLINGNVELVPQISE